MPTAILPRETRVRLSGVVSGVIAPAAGIETVDGRGQAWKDFAGWGVNQEPIDVGLAETLRVPYAPWTSDRSSLASGRRGI